MIRRLIVIAVLAAGCRNVSGPGDRARDPRQWELFALKAERRLAAQRLGLHRVLDSLPDIVARFPAGASTLVAGVDSASDRRTIEAELDRLWRGAASPDLRIAVVFSRLAGGDTLRRWGTFEGTIHPERTDGKTCVVALAARVDWQGRWAGPSLRRLRSFAAPCLYLARFGRPGRGVARWLAETGYQGLSSAEWLFRPGVNVPDFDYRYQAEQGEWFAPLFLAFGYDRMPPYWSGPAAVGCLAGRPSACDEFVRGPVRDRRGAPLPPLAGVALADDDYAPELSGRAQWVDDLIRTRGEATFGQFWRSDADLPTAFRTAYGEDLGPEVARWERHDWEQRRERPPVRLGAPIDPATLATGLGWVLLIVLLPLVTARRLTMY